MEEMERLAKLRRVVLDAVLEPAPEDAERFRAALQLVKSDTRALASAVRPRGTALAGPGFESFLDVSSFDPRPRERVAALALETRRELCVASTSLTPNSEMSVKEEVAGLVFVARDKTDSFLCVVKMTANGSRIQDVFLLRSDEKPGKNYCNRTSAFAHWRKMTKMANDELGAGRITTPSDVWKWCQNV